MPRSRSENKVVFGLRTVWRETYGDPQPKNSFAYTGMHMTTGCSNFHSEQFSKSTVIYNPVLSIYREPHPPRTASEIQLNINDICERAHDMKETQGRHTF